MKHLLIAAIAATSVLLTGCQTTPTSLTPQASARVQSVNGIVHIKQNEVQATDPGGVHATVGGNAGASFGLTLIANVAIQGIAQASADKINAALPGYDFRAAVERELAVLTAQSMNPKLRTPIMVTTGLNAADNALIKQMDSDVKAYFDVQYAISGKTISAYNTIRLYSAKRSLYHKDHKGGENEAIVENKLEIIKVTGVKPENARMKMDALAKKVANQIMIALTNI